MKTVMKKLLSLALVAILLVSAVPFQASAAEGDPITVKYKVYVDDKYTSEKTISVPLDGGIIVLDEGYAMSHLDSKENREFVKWEDSVGQAANHIELNPEWLKVADNYNGYWLNLYIKTKHVHNYTNPTITKEATCVEAGEKTLTCACGATTTESISVNPDEHDWSDWSLNTTNGKYVRNCKRTGCNASETRDANENDGVTLVTFIAPKDQKFTRTFKIYQKVYDLPAAPDVSGQKFKGWYSGENGQGDALASGDEWDGKHTTYYAYYVESTDDNVSTLSVYAKFFIGGVQQGNTEFLYEQEFKDGDSMLKWLNNNESTTSKYIFSKVSAEDYEWNPRYYFNYSGTEPLTEQNLIADGNKSVVVKVYGKKSTQANVLLYVHQYNSSSKKYETKNIYEMSGYTAGNTVTKSAADTLVKKHYTGKNMTITGLYSDTAWEQLLAGQNPTAANGIKVSDNGTMKVHVIIKNATAGSSSTADKTNPKTGDMIFVPMMVMLASAAAVAFVYMGSKKRAVR